MYTILSLEVCGWGHANFQDSRDLLISDHFWCHRRNFDTLTSPSVHMRPQVVMTIHFDNKDEAPSDIPDVFSHRRLSTATQHDQFARHVTST